MTISTHFQSEITTAGLGITLDFDSTAAGHGEFEWSYSWTGSTYRCDGGSELACEHAASELLEALGFRFYTPNPEFWVRPSSLTTGLDSGAPQTFWIQTARFQLNYGHSWEDSLGASRSIMEDAHDKWCILNNDGPGFDGPQEFPYPAGHNWQTVIEDNVTYFTANPTFTFPEFDPVVYAGLTSSEKSTYTFDLAALDSTETDNLAKLCAGWRLSEGLNSYNRDIFSPPDSDYHNEPNGAFPFIKAVATYVQNGFTGTVGPYTNPVGVPGAQLGVYLYTGIAYPPTIPAASGGNPAGWYGDGVYGQLALAYKAAPPSGYSYRTYTELVGDHARLNDGVVLREYTDNAQWRGYLPANNTRIRSTYMDRYDDLKSAAVSAGSDLIGVNSENAANWLLNMVFMRQYTRKRKTGSYTWAQALDDVIDDVYGGDTAVRDLYEYLDDPTTVFSKYSLKAIFNYVDDMATSTYKTYWKHACVIWYEYFTLPEQDTISPDYADTFALALAKYAGHVAAVRELDIVHSYAILRTDCNGVLTDRYPLLRIPTGTRPEPAWHATPTLPNNTDFTAYKAILDAIPDRDTELDSADLVLIRGVTPHSSEAAATTHVVEANCRFTYVGPGTVTITYPAQTDGDGNPLPAVVEEYPLGSGIHTIDTRGQLTATWDGGILFRNAWPQSQNTTDGTGDNDYYLYIPTRYDGEVLIETTNRCTITDASGLFTLYREDDPVETYVAPTNLGPGQCRIARTTTIGRIIFDKANPYLSPDGTVVLMSRAIADEDFPKRTKITRG
jgi:hypothetical protein